MALLSYALCAVDDVRDTPGVSSSLSTGYIERKVNAATEMIERYCNRRFKLTTYTNEEYDASHELDLVLRQRPITSFSSLEVRNTSLNDNDWDAIDTLDYFVDTDAGIVKAVATFYGDFNRWRVTYTAGYETIPADLREACATLAAFLVSTTTGQSVKRMREGGREIEYNNPFSQGGGSVINDLGLDEVLNSYANTVISGR